MASLGLHLLTIVLGVIFVFLGHIKLTPQFFPEYYYQMRSEFGKLNQEFPFYRLTGWRPLSRNYRLAMGVIETSSGSLLLLGGAFSQSMANVVLLVIITNMIIALQKLHYSIEYIAAATFLGFLLVLRLVLTSRTRTIRTAKRRVGEKDK